MGRNNHKHSKRDQRSSSNHQYDKHRQNSNRFAENPYPPKRDIPYKQEKQHPEGNPRTILAFFDSELSKSKKSIKAFDVDTQKDYNILRDNLLDEQGQPVDATLLKNGRLLKITLDEKGNVIKARFASEEDLSMLEESKETPGDRKKKGWVKKNEGNTQGSEVDVRNGKVASIGEKVEIACEGTGFTMKFNVDRLYFTREPNIGDEVKLVRRDGETLEVSFVTEGEGPARKAQTKSAWGNSSGSQAIQSELSQKEFPPLSSEIVQPNTPLSNPPLQVDNPSSSQHFDYQKNPSRSDSTSENPYSSSRLNTIPQPLPPTFQTPSNPPSTLPPSQYSHSPNIPSFPAPTIPTQITTHNSSTFQQSSHYSAIPPLTTHTGLNSTNLVSPQYETLPISPLITPTGPPLPTISSSNQSYPIPALDNPAMRQSNPYSSPISDSSPQLPSSLPTYSENPSSTQSNPYSSSISVSSLSSYPIPAPNNPSISQSNPYSTSSSVPSSQISQSIDHLMPYNPYKSVNIPTPPPPPAVSPVCSPLSPVGYIDVQKLPVDILKSISPSDSHFTAKIESLSSFYESVRLVKKEGNSFYLALGVVYLEHLCFRSTSIPEFEYFTRRLDILYQDSTLSSVPDVTYFIESCTNLLRIKINFTCAVDPLQDYFNDVKFVRGMVIAIRNLTVKYLEMAFGDVRFRNLFRGNIIDRVRHYGVEAEKEEYLAVAYAFGVSFRMVTIGKEINYEKYEPGDTYVSTLIDTLNINGQHDILYTKQGH